MMTYRTNRKNTGKKGVAIVIVLGLIAVLMMMAVAFSIHMRIERTGAANYRYGVQARHMVYAGLANAIRDIDELMKDASGNPVIYPEWDVEVSDEGTLKASVLNQSSAQYIPEHLREVARKKEAKWNLITDDNEIQRGRYAFVIINSSGLLDANKVWATNNTVRLSGAGTEEMRLDNVPGVTGHSQLVARARQDVRYESLPELVNKNPHVGDGRSFSMFSLSPVKDQYDIDGSIKDRVYIGPDTSKWKPADIIGAFADAGVPNASLAYKNLLDYTDADSVPQDLAAGCVEKVPMINEFVFLYQLNFDAGGAVSGTAGVITEWVYPFVRESKEAFSMTYDIEITPGSGNTIAAVVPSALAGQHNQSDITGGNASPMSYGTVPNLVTFLGNTTNDTIDINFDVAIKAYIQGPGGRVDEVPSPYTANSGLKMTISIPGLARGSSVTHTNSWECRDPRFNWVTDGSEPQWYSYAMMSVLSGFTATPGSQNKVTDMFFDPGSFGFPDAFDLDDDLYMHVADRPLETIGELGYLCYDWLKTIRLYEHQAVPNPYPEANKYHAVLDKFTIWDTDYRRGLVNVNTTNLDLLASAFYSMPEEEYSTNRLTSWAAAQQIAQQIIVNGPYTNLSELGKTQIDWDALTTGPTEICRESGIRNSVGMLTARDNFFTVIIRADSFSAGVGGSLGHGMTLATTRAVAEIWRDPIPDENGNNKCFIRSFRFVED